MFSSTIKVLDSILDKSVIFGYDKIGYSIRKQNFDLDDTKVDLTEKIALITGANAGIGRATTELLVEKGAEVIMVCRNLEKAEQTKAEILKKTPGARIHIEIANLAEKEDIIALTKRLGNHFLKLDILVNNAGVMLNSREENLNHIEKTFAINTLGYYRMIQQCRPLLAQSGQGRIINVSSGGMYLAALNLEDLFWLKRDYDGMKAYAETKRQELLMTQQLATELKKDNILINAMHPGWVNTNAVRSSMPNFYSVTKAILREPYQGADTIFWLAVKPNFKETGKFFFDRQERKVHRLKSTISTKQEIKKFMTLLDKLS